MDNAQNVNCQRKRQIIRAVLLCTLRGSSLLLHMPEAISGRYSDLLWNAVIVNSKII